MSILNQKPVIKLKQQPTWETMYADNNLFPEGYQPSTSLFKMKLPTESYLKSNPVKPLVVKKEPWSQSIANHQTEVDALKEVNKDLTTSPFKAPSTIGMANIATGISTAANVATSIYGAIQASKMQPTLMKYQSPTEAVLVSDNSNAIETAGQGNIDKSINTSRSNLKRNGIVGMDGILLSKENEALNQLSGQLAQYRTGIESQNAQIENSVNAQNKQAEMQTEQFNASTQNQFDQYKSGLIGMGMKNATDAIQTGTESIFNNIANSKQMKISSISNQLAQINKLMTENPNWKDNYPNPNSLFEKKALLEKQLEQENNSLLG